MTIIMAQTSRAASVGTPREAQPGHKPANTTGGMYSNPAVIASHKVVERAAACLIL